MVTRLDLAFPFVMSLDLTSTRETLLAPVKAAVPVRLTLKGRSALILVAELDGALARGWEAARNTTFWNAFQTHGIAVNAVVIVSPGTLPRRHGGALDETAVIADFAPRRGYLRDELEAWVVHRLCEVLYLAPGEFDPGLDWARRGVDSAVALELLADLEDWLGVRLPQALSECRSPRELASEATTRLLDDSERLPWWRSPWAATGGA